MTETCERCVRTPGWESVVVGGVSRLRRCACWRARHACPPTVPAEFASAAWSNWYVNGASHRALNVARGFVAGSLPDADLFISGPVGTGKTRLACTILNALWRAGSTSVEFARVPLALYTLEPHHRVDADRAFSRLCTVEVLVLDDFGAERTVATDFTRRTLLMLYEARSDAGLRTVWTSLRSPADLCSFLGDDRLSSRLMGRARHVVLDGPDRRPPRRPHSRPPDSAAA